jgi:hypothetical protein
MPGHLTLVLAADPAGAPYLAGIVAGFVVGAVGHLFAARLLVVIGIAIVLITTVLFLIASDPTSGSF